MLQNPPVLALPTSVLPLLPAIAAAPARLHNFLRQALVRGALLLAITMAQAFAQPAFLVLQGEASARALDASLEFFLDPTGLLGPDQLEQLPAGQFAPMRRSQPHIIEGGTLWLRFDAVAMDPADHWRLSLPLPGLDDVLFHFRDADGQWLQQRAGDTIRMSNWPQPGRYPVFMLGQQQDLPTRYYVQIRHARVPFSTLPRLLSDVQLVTLQQQEHLLLGVYFGLAGLVVALALANALAWRDLGFGSYAVYMAFFAAAQGTLSGVAGLYWWPQWPELNNPAVFVLSTATGAAAMWFVRTVTTPRRFSRALDWFMLGLMALLPLIGLLDAVLPSIRNLATINALISASLLALLIAIGVSLAEGDRHARWLAVGFMPVLLATLFPLLRNLGLIPSGFMTEYGMMLASSIEAPILFYGLLKRVAQRREPNARATGLRTIDPLTGLFSTGVLVRKLRQGLGTAGRYPQPFALLVINFTNHASLQRQHGRETGDRAMVMAAARIRAVAGPADMVARVGDCEFALLMGGPVNAQEANNAATKIIASGLRLSNELPDAEPLRFHIAVGHLGMAEGVSPQDAAACLTRMQQYARDLNDGSPKAICLVKL